MLGRAVGGTEVGGSGANSLVGTFYPAGDSYASIGKAAARSVGTALQSRRRKLRRLWRLLGML